MFLFFIRGIINAKMNITKVILVMIKRIKLAIIFISHLKIITQHVNRGRDKVGQKFFRIDI